jgi:hypothetical protein
LNSLIEAHSWKRDEGGGGREGERERERKREGKREGGRREIRVSEGVRDGWTEVQWEKRGREGERKRKNGREGERERDGGHVKDNPWRGLRRWIQGDLGGSEGRTEAELEGGSSEEIEVGVAGGKERREGRGAKKGEGGGWREREVDTARERERERERARERWKEGTRKSERASDQEREREIHKARASREGVKKRERTNDGERSFHVCVPEEGGLEGLALIASTDREKACKKEGGSKIDRGSKGGGRGTWRALLQALIAPRIEGF